jgi:hypothetical protein
MTVWTHQLSCCESYILLSVFNSNRFLSSSSIPRPLAYRQSLFPSNRYCMVALKTCFEVMIFISVIPSEIRRFKFAVSWLCATTLQLTTFVVKRARHRAVTAPSPRCRRTTLFKDWRYINCLPRVGWRFADWDGYRSKEPINVSNVPFPIFSTTPTGAT